jgi:hypothetical protein
MSRRRERLCARPAAPARGGLEATVGIEPTIRVLQTRALPLGYVARGRPRIPAAALGHHRWRWRRRGRGPHVEHRLDSRSPPKGAPAGNRDMPPSARRTGVAAVARVSDPSQLPRGNLAGLQQPWHRDVIARRAGRPGHNTRLHQPTGCHARRVRANMSGELSSTARAAVEAPHEPHRQWLPCAARRAAAPVTGGRVRRNGQTRAGPHRPGRRGGRLSDGGRRGREENVDGC